MLGAALRGEGKQGHTGLVAHDALVHAGGADRNVRKLRGSGFRNDRAVGEHANVVVLQHEEEARHGLASGGGADHAQAGADDVGRGGQVPGNADFGFTAADHKGTGGERILDGLDGLLFRNILALALLDGHVLRSIVLKQGRVVRIDDLEGNAGFAAFLQRRAHLFGVADEDGFDEAFADQLGGGGNHAPVFTVGVDHGTFPGAAFFEATFEHAHYRPTLLMSRPDSATTVRSMRT